MNRAGDIIQTMRKWPLTSVNTVIGDASAMILAPHPDDETLGCGGLIAEACRNGQPPIVVIVSDGAASHPGSVSYPPARLRGVRAQEASEALAILGLPPSRCYFLGLPDTKVPRDGPAFEQAVDALAELALAEHCEIICGPWQHDPHCDHEATHVIARAVADRMGLILLSYPVWGWLLPENKLLSGPVLSGYRLDIVTQLATKKRALTAHRSQYGNLITDDPGGFRLPENLLAIVEQPYEVFISAP